MAFLDDSGTTPDTQEPPDPEADARAAALTPERAALLAVEIDGLSTLLIARAIEMGMTFKGFAVTMAHNWDAKHRQFDNAREACSRFTGALAEKNRKQEAAPAAAAPPSGGPPPGAGPVSPAGGAGKNTEPACASGVVGCDEPQAHTHLVSGRVVIVPGPDVDCPLIDCNIPGPHDHGTNEGQDAKGEPR